MAKSTANGQSFSNSNGPGDSGGAGPCQVRHGWFCYCWWCLAGLTPPSTS